jgi:hypothetical protein
MRGVFKMRNVEWEIRGSRTAPPATNGDRSALIFQPEPPGETGEFNHIDRKRRKGFKPQMNTDEHRLPKTISRNGRNGRNGFLVGSAR